MMSNTNPNMQSDIEHIVMRRVHTVHAFRPLLSGGMLAALVFIAALWGIGREVWVAHVFANAPHAGMLALGRFYLAAFEHTRALVQVLVLVTAGSALLFLRALARPVAALFAARYA